MTTTPPPVGSWRAAYLAIFDASVSMCAQCHVTGGVLGPPDFSTPDKAYDSIVDKETSTLAQAQCKGMGKYVVPGNCEESLLYNKLSQDTPKCGRRMPPSSDAMPMRVAPDKLEALCAWIKAGAKKD